MSVEVLCRTFNWKPYNCKSSQACKYVCFLAKTKRYSHKLLSDSIFYHHVKGRVLANWSDPLLAQTIKGIKKLESTPEDVKDPLRTAHLQKMCRYVDLKKEFIVHQIPIASSFLVGRTLQKVSC